MENTNKTEVTASPPVSHVILNEILSGRADTAVPAEPANVSGASGVSGELTQPGKVFLLKDFSLSIHIDLTAEQEPSGYKFLDSPLRKNHCVRALIGNYSRALESLPTQGLLIGDAPVKTLEWVNELYGERLLNIARLRTFQAFTGAAQKENSDDSDESALKELESVWNSYAPDIRFSAALLPAGQEEVAFPVVPTVFISACYPEIAHAANTQLIEPHVSGILQNLPAFIKPTCFNSLMLNFTASTETLINPNVWYFLTRFREHIRVQTSTVGGNPWLAPYLHRDFHSDISFSLGCIVRSDK